MRISRGMKAPKHMSDANWQKALTYKTLQKPSNRVRLDVRARGQLKLLYMLPNPVRPFAIIPIHSAPRDLKCLMDTNLQSLPGPRRRRLLSSQPLLTTIRTVRSIPSSLPISLTFDISHHDSQLIRPETPVLASVQRTQGQWPLCTVPSPA